MLDLMNPAAARWRLGRKHRDLRRNERRDLRKLVWHAVEIGALAVGVESRLSFRLLFADPYPSSLIVRNVIRKETAGPGGLFRTGN
jgi:hypothetical protein